MKTIKKFNEIEIVPNSLVVFDIDETLIKFDGIDGKWWANKFKKYYKMTNNYELVDSLSYNDWVNLVSKIQPELVDEQVHQFVNLIKQNNCHIILLTARCDKLKELTLKHLEQVNLNFDHANIHFNDEKGDYLHKIVHQHFHHIDNIIVIDDMEPNLTDIKEKMKDTKFNLHLYRMKL